MRVWNGKVVQCLLQVKIILHSTTSQMSPWDTQRNLKTLKEQKVTWTCNFDLQSLYKGWHKKKVSHHSLVHLMSITFFHWTSLIIFDSFNMGNIIVSWMCVQYFLSYWSLKFHYKSVVLSFVPRFTFLFDLLPNSFLIIFIFKSRNLTTFGCRIILKSLYCLKYQLGQEKLTSPLT